MGEGQLLSGVHLGLCELGVGVAHLAHLEGRRRHPCVGEAAHAVAHPAEVCHELAVATESPLVGKDVTLLLGGVDGVAAGGGGAVEAAVAEAARAAAREQRRAHVLRAVKAARAVGRLGSHGALALVLEPHLDLARRDFEVGGELLARLYRREFVYEEDLLQHLQSMRWDLPARGLALPLLRVGPFIGWRVVVVAAAKVAVHLHGLLHGQLL